MSQEISGFRNNNGFSTKFNRFKALTKKNIKITFREKQNYFWIFGYPILFLLIFGIAFNSVGGGGRSTYSIVIFNYDSEDVMNPTYQTYDANISLIFHDILNNTSQDPSNQLNESIKVVSKFTNGTIIDENSAFDLIKSSSIDAIIFIPKDFSEKINANQPTKINITAIPDAVTQSIVESIVSNIIGNIVLGSKNINLPQVYIEDPLEIEENRNAMDWMGPGILIMGTLINISNTATLFSHDREKGMMRRLDSTPVSRTNTLISSTASMFVIAIIQIIITLIVMKIMGVYISPNASLFNIFFIAILMIFTSIGLGLIVGVLSKTADAAGGISWMFILPLQFLGGAFFSIPINVAKWIPSYYAMNAARQIILYGNPLSSVITEITVLLICGIVTMSIGIILFKKKSEI